MTQQQSVFFTTPVGRIVRGNLYEPQDKDLDGRPLVIKNGPDAGKPRKDYFFAIAVPKQGEQHWAQTAWGAVIWQTGHAAWPHGQGQAPTFAWKIADGDSQVPNSRGKRPCDQEGYRGCWIVHFSGGFPPKIVSADGSQAIDQSGVVKPGFYVQVNASVRSNESSQKPGVYLNHRLVAFTAYGAEIVYGPDATEVGFGGAPLPAGASLTPVAAMAAGAAPAMPGVPGVAPVAPGVPSVAPVAPVMPGVVVQPSTAFMQAPPQRQMTPKAGAYTYEQFKAAGWPDDALIREGYVT